MPRWTAEDSFNSAVENAAARFNVPSELIKAVIGQESAFRPNAYRAEPKIGDASIGLMQILLGTAKGEGYTGSAGDSRSLTGLYDPATNIQYGTSFLASMLERARGHVPSAISAYNGGFRPTLGFGAPATTPLTICLARDAAGKCIQSRNVPVGEYANQPYVNAVLSNYNYFVQKAISTPPSTPPPSGGGTSPPLSIPHHVINESENGGDTGRSAVGPARTQIWETVMGRILAVASGKKWVSVAGLVLTALGFLCLDHRADLDAVISSEWAARLCGAVTLLGSLMASFGRGLADRRHVRHKEH